MPPFVAFSWCMKLRIRYSKSEVLALFGNPNPAPSCWGGDAKVWKSGGMLEWGGERRGEFAEKTCGGGQSCFCGSVPKKKWWISSSSPLASAVSASLCAGRRGQFWRLLGPQPAEGKAAVVAKRGKKRRGGGLRSTDRFLKGKRGEFTFWLIFLSSKWSRDTAKGLDVQCIERGEAEGYLFNFWLRLFLPFHLYDLSGNVCLNTRARKCLLVPPSPVEWARWVGSYGCQAREITFLSSPDSTNMDPKLKLLFLVISTEGAPYQEMYPSSFFRCIYPPPLDGDKKMPVTTPIFGAQKGLFWPVFPYFFSKNTTRRGVCLRCLDGYFCDIKTGLKMDPF